MNILYYLIILLSIFNSGGIPFLKYYYISIFIYIISIPLLLKYKNDIKSLNKRNIILCLIIFIIQSIISSGIYFSNFFFTIISHIITSIILLSIYSISHEKFHNVIFKVLKGMLYFHYLALFVYIIFPNYLNIVNIGEAQSYKTIFGIFFYERDVYNSLSRPCGIFWEPGILQFYMNMLLYYSLFVYKKYYLALFSIIAIISIGSSTGYILLFIQAMFLIKKYYRNYKPVIIITLIIIGVFSNIILNNYEEKVYGTRKGSYLARTYDLYTAVNLISHSPIFGIGIDKDNYIQMQSEYGYYQSGISYEEFRYRGNTNSIAMTFVSLGVPLAIFLLSHLFRQKIYNQRLLYFLLVVVFLMSEPLLFTPFFIYMVFSNLFLNE